MGNEVIRHTSPEFWKRKENYKTKSAVRLKHMWRSNAPRVLRLVRLVEISFSFVPPPIFYICNINVPN